MTLAKSVMKLTAAYPDEECFHNWEVLKRKEFLNGSKEFQEKIYINLVRAAYEHEKKYCTLEKFFPKTKLNDFEGKSFLDLGAFCGGRTIRWMEKFNFSFASGFDINPLFVDAFNSYKRKYSVANGENIHLYTGFGEKMPFDDDSFDYIISFDVLEHVKCPETVLNECYRVLKPGGKAFIVFPQYHSLFESHLGMVTWLPGIHWFFSSRKLFSAYYEIIKERGDSANWYSIKSPIAEAWEKLPSLNGTTIKKFNNCKSRTKFSKVYEGHVPVFSDGRRAEKYLIFRVLKRLCWLPAHLPVLREYFQSKIVVILQK